jgi:hypothetical protein
VSHLGDRVAPLVDGQLPPDQAEKATMHVASCDRCREAVDLERRTKQRLAALGPVEPRADFLHQLMQLAGPAGPLPPRSGHVPGTPRPEYAQYAPYPEPAQQRVPVGAGAALSAPPALPSGYSAEAAYQVFGNAAAVDPAFSARERPPARRGSVRPGTTRQSLQRFAGASRSRASRTRVAVVMVGAACLVGAGVAGGLTDAGPRPATGPQVSPAIASLVGEHVATTTTLPLTDTSLTWGRAGYGR